MNGPGENKSIQLFIYHTVPAVAQRDSDRAAPSQCISETPQRVLLDSQWEKASLFPNNSVIPW